MYERLKVNDLLTEKQYEGLFLIDVNEIYNVSE
nr:MAG TPA: hypothetical protein [Caudoviricetes sp.]